MKHTVIRKRINDTLGEIDDFIKKSDNTQIQVY